MKFPFIKFFPTDWLAEPSLRACSLAARGLWMDMLSMMHLAPRRGYLLAATGFPISPVQLARMTGSTADEVNQLLAELRSSGAFSCTDDGTGTIYSRRMVREEGKRDLCAEAGRRGGGNPTFKGQSKGAPKGAPKGHTKALDARGQKLEEESVPSELTAPPPVDSEKPPDETKSSGRKKKPPGEPRAEPTGPAADARRDFCNRWKAKYRTEENYGWDFGKHGKQLAWMLAQVGEDPARLGTIFARFFADDDPFFTGGRHLFDKLRQSFPRWQVEPTTAVPKASTRDIFASDLLRQALEAQQQIDAQTLELGGSS